MNTMIKHVSNSESKPKNSTAPSSKLHLGSLSKAPCWNPSRKIQVEPLHHVWVSRYQMQTNTEMWSPVRFQISVVFPSFPHVKIQADLSPGTRSASTQVTGPCAESVVRRQRKGKSASTLVCCVLSRFGHVHLFETLWTVARQALLSMGFSRLECQSGLSCLPPGDLPDAGTEPMSVTSPALAGSFFTTSAT